MDLYPTALFRQDNNGKSPIACGLPEVSIQRINGAVVTGVLIYAQHWNPPPGWLRISASEDFTCTRLSTMCDSDNAIYTGELDDAWKSEVTNNKSLGTRVSDKKGAAKTKVDLQIPVTFVAVEVRDESDLHCHECGYRSARPLRCSQCQRATCHLHVRWVNGYTWCDCCVVRLRPRRSGFCCDRSAPSSSTHEGETQQIQRGQVEPKWQDTGACTDNLPIHTRRAWMLMLPRHLLPLRTHTGSQPQVPGLRHARLVLPTPPDDVSQRTAISECHARSFRGFPTS